MGKLLVCCASPTSSLCSRSDDKAPDSASENAALRCFMSIRWLRACGEASLGAIEGIHRRKKRG